jgi:hypothetical protein
MSEHPCCLCGEVGARAEMFECLGQLICSGHDADDVRAWIAYKLGGPVPRPEE